MREAELQFFLPHGGAVWTLLSDSPHITPFRYQIARFSWDDEQEAEELGEVTGYRIAQDWTAGSDLALWDQADSLDGDAVAYVDALIRELNAVDVLWDCGLSLDSAQHTTIVRHVEPEQGVRPDWLWAATTATLLAMDAPALMLVDPRGMGQTKDVRPQARLETRGRIATLGTLGFTRMVGAPFVWGWNAEFGDSQMSTYDYVEVRDAARSGRLSGIIDEQLAMAVYGELSEEVLTSAGFPEYEEPID